MITKNHVFIGLLSIAIIVLAISGTLLLDVTRPDPRSHENAETVKQDSQLDAVRNYLLSPGQVTSSTPDNSKPQTHQEWDNSADDNPAPAAIIPGLTPGDPNSPQTDNPGLVQPPTTADPNAPVDNSTNSAVDQDNPPDGAPTDSTDPANNANSNPGTVNDDNANNSDTGGPSSAPGETAPAEDYTIPNFTQ